MSTNDRALGRIDVESLGGFTVEDARALINGMRNRTASALALHRQMDATGELARLTLLEYRCRSHGCLLARVFTTPVGPAVYKPQHRYSPGRNARTAAAARERLTTDGERRWVESADLLDVDPPPGLGVELWVNCDHLLDHALPSEQICLDLEGDTRVILLPATDSGVR